MAACLTDVGAVTRVVGQAAWLGTGWAFSLVATMFYGVVTLGCYAVEYIIRLRWR